MKSEDPLIKSFFEAMKEEDLKKPVPDFEELCPAEKPVMRTLPLYLKMAAGVALLVTAGAIVYFSQSDTREEQTIIAREVEPQEQQTLDEFMSWEEPTQNLLEDF